MRICLTTNCQPLNITHVNYTHLLARKPAHLTLLYNPKHYSPPVSCVFPYLPDSITTLGKLLFATPTLVHPASSSSIVLFTVLVSPPGFLSSPGHVNVPLCSSHHPSGFFSGNKVRKCSFHFSEKHFHPSSRTYPIFSRTPIALCL